MGMWWGRRLSYGNHKKARRKLSSRFVKRDCGVSLQSLLYRSWRYPVALTLIFLCTLLPSTSSFSGPPMPYDAWSNSNGRIVAACPAGFTCDDNTVGQGVLQRTLISSNGQRYMQLILEDGAIAGDGQFRSETFIDASNTQRWGAAGKQTINQTGVENINYGIEFSTGWANTPGSPAVIINQTVRDTTTQGVGFMSSFDFALNRDAGGNATGYNFGLRQEVTGSAALNGIAAAGQDYQVFVLRRAGGDMVTAAGSATLPASAGGMGGAGAVGGMGGGGGAAAPAAPPAPAAGGGAAAPAPAPAAGGGGGMMMSFSRSTTSNNNNTQTNTGAAAGSVAPATNSSRGATLTAAIPSGGTFRTNAFDGGAASAGDIGGPAPCGTEPPVGVGNGVPPTCANDPAPPNPGSVGVGAGAGAAAPPGTLNPPPRNGAPPGGQFTGSPAGMAGGGPAGGTVAWSAGNEIQVLWIGQICQGCQTVAGMGMGGGTGNFSFQAYENLSSGASAQTRSIFSAAPFGWNGVFGAQPGL